MIFLRILNPKKLKSVFVTDFLQCKIFIYKPLCSLGILFYFASYLGINTCSSTHNIYKKQESKQLHPEIKNCRRETLGNLIRQFSVSSSIYCQTMELENNFPNLQKIGLLNNNNILIKDKKNTENVLSSLLLGSFDNLQLLVDFDYTLTRGHFNDEKSLCSWGVLDNSPHMPPHYRERALELLHKFHPIEVDPKKPESEKIPYMIEWYTTVVDLLKTCNLSKEILREMVAESNVKFRYETEQLFNKLMTEEVPMLIFSAGMGDVLEHVLWHFGLYFKNVKVVSNFFQYDGEGIMTGVKGDIIHVFNKNENAIHSSDYFDQLKHRSNVILLGDSLGDIKMAQGVPQPSNILKIGFFNHNTMDGRIDSYLDTYDVVLVKDQTMSVVNAILNEMRR